MKRYKKSTVQVLFNNKESALVHIENGAKNVLISAPAKNADFTPNDAYFTPL